MFNYNIYWYLTNNKHQTDYRTALKEVETSMTAESNTPEGEKLDVLITLIEAYERKNFPLDLPNPVEAIKFEMEQKGLTVKDLEPMIGKSNRVHEVLNRKRALTLKETFAKLSTSAADS